MEKEWGSVRGRGKTFFKRVSSPPHHCLYFNLNIMKVYFNTFGCKTNQYDSALIGQLLEDQGLERAETLESADWVVVNTCSVTRRGEDKARQWIRMLAREHAGLNVAVVGCAVEVSNARFSGLPGVKLLLGTEEKFRIGELLKDFALNGDPRQIFGGITSAGKYQSLPVLAGHPGRARAHVKIQDGCDNRCTYCIVPYTRGPSRSRPAEDILAEALELDRNGHAEIVLTGIHIGKYGAEFEGNTEIYSLAALVEYLLINTSRVRFRLGSVEVGELDRHLLELIAAEDRLCRHLHIPLQHGADSVLRRMERKYDTAQFRKVVEQAAGSIGELGLGTDVIVGFPGESEDEFQACSSFINSLPFSYLHVFPYSVREGTPAAGMPGQVPKDIVRERVKRLRTISDLKRKSFNVFLVGRRLRVIAEEPLVEGRISSRSDNYVRCYHSGEQQENKIYEVRATGLFRDGLECEPV